MKSGFEEENKISQADANETLRPTPLPRRVGRQSRVTGALGVLPVGLNIPPETVVGGADTEYARFRYGSVRGYAHRQYGEPRQDAVKVIRPGDSDKIVVAIADGVGSAPRAAEGAQFAADYACKVIAQIDQSAPEWTDILFEQVAAAMVKYSKELECEPLDLSTTLVVSIVVEGKESTIIDVAWIGDSVPFVLPQEASAPDEMVLSTQTAALPSSLTDRCHTRFEIGDSQIFLVATDGFANLITRGPVDNLVEEWCLELPTSLGKFLWDIDTIARTFDDDRTVFAYQRMNEDLAE